MAVHAQELPLDGDGLHSNNVLSFNPSKDPLGDVDTYRMISSGDVEGEWSKDDGRNITEKMKELMTFGSIVHVDVKLVGFDGDGNYDVNVNEADFLRYFETVLEEHEKEAMVLNARAGAPHSLPIRRKFFFRVMKAKKSLNEDLASRIRSWIVTEMKDEDRERVIKNGSPVPVSIVDDVIRKDYLESDPSQTHTIYILNPKKVSAPPKKEEASKAVEAHDPDHPPFHEGDLPHEPDPAWMHAASEPEYIPYWYDGALKGGSSPGEQKQKSACGTTMWAGLERYMWIDLTAGPILFGPHTSGEGLVSELSIPRLDNFQVESLDWNGGHHFAYIQEFLAELVSLVCKTSDLLIEPSLHHFPVPLAKKLRLHLVHITNDPKVRTQYADETGFLDGVPQVRGWDNIKSQLGHLGGNIAVQGQTILYNRTVVQLNDCKFCLAAYAASLKSHTSTVFRGQLKTQVHEYLDSKELHEQLLNFLNKEELGFAQELGIFGWVPTQFLDLDSAYREHWTIPIFLFDLQDTALILLDRFHQAVSFPEMVIALQTRSSPATVDFSCADEMITVDPRDATRPMLGALLQTGWGVAPTHEHFSGKKQQAEVNYMWSAAATPFGPFSTSEKLTFSLVDAARRNLVFSALNFSIAQVSLTLEQFSKFGKNMEDVLLPSEHVHFVRRWNVLKFKILRTSTYLSLLNFNTALFYARSTRHDVKAIRNTVLHAGKFVHTYIGCLHDEKPSILAFLVYFFAGAALLIMAYVFLHNLLAKRSKAAFKKKL
ncbi:hypothetical protein GUITHDRAFT_114391 [Guillardia theta CCMP2712]|uniref:DUF7906 domain-containing protein n=2 Tax=Guillardia theta TaxID=55529 RepID=L1ITK7_GUITC|nr:hypothetical protein GUITHDRAFT_114391 [Guillardia theta CCMP2712]EKX39432.1 hypothetical protein GUITHDRAFT_114391 [Guillardia theta CCMP2712]|eukprot:XP_005826412.1 hypothetical protein GUITHDRAFT_114391 [Guillardia theta CCMP2712]